MNGSVFSCVPKIEPVTFPQDTDLSTLDSTSWRDLFCLFVGNVSLESKAPHVYYALEIYSTGLWNGIYGRGSMEKASTSQRNH